MQSLIVLLATLAPGTTPALAPGPMPDFFRQHSCDRFVRDIDRSANEVDGRGIYAGGRDLRWALTRCPQDERLWYLLARYSEADWIPPADRQFPDAVAAIETAYKNFPTSRIAVVRARVIGTIEAARSAVAIDPSYRPARIVLAAALLRAGSARDALDILEPMANHYTDEKVGLQYSFTGWLTLARARLATGDPRGAAKAARRAGGVDLDDPYELLEPSGKESEWWTVNGLASLAVQDDSRATHMLLVGATYGSREALAELQHASPAVRKCLAAIVHDSARELESEDRTVATGIAAWVLGDYEKAAGQLLAGIHGARDDRACVSSLIREHEELASVLRANVAAKNLPLGKMQDARRVLDRKSCSRWELLTRH